ncbi:Hypothetical_protein [Hexamita inflata]|uniref:Hypothetical_protein n=1 Tax=Hexamita inflata TaxID=28002 RepID=A0AA86UIY0_9EUKA|nr:Hypothetical protein HINF_LOCUS40577 [Hexamita inflata]
MDKQPMVQIIIGQMVYVVPVTICHSESCDFYEFTYIHNQINNTIRVSISMDISQCMVQILIDKNKYILQANMQHVQNGYIYEFELFHNKNNYKMSIYVPYQPITAFKPVTTLKPFIPVCQTGCYQKLSNSVSKFTPLTVQKTTVQENSTQKRIITPFKPLQTNRNEPELQTKQQQEEVETIEENQSSQEQFDKQQKQQCVPVNIPHLDDNKVYEKAIKSIIAIKRDQTKRSEQAYLKNDQQKEDDAKNQEDTHSNSSQEQFKEITDRPALIKEELEKFVSFLQNKTDEQQKIIYEQMKNIFGSRNNEDYIDIEITPIQNIYQMINNNQNKKGFLEYIQNTNNSLKLLECLQQKVVQQEAGRQIEKQMINNQQLSTPGKEQRILNDNVRGVIKNQVTQNIVNNYYFQEMKPGDTIIDVK